MLAQRQDDELLDLLATVHQAMGNFPEAGALWFVTGRDDEVARAALDAWRQRFGNDIARLFSIPAPVRRAREHDLRRIQEREARRNRPDPDIPRFTESGDASFAGTLGCLLFFLVLLVLGVLLAVGAVTAVRWVL